MRKRLQYSAFRRKKTVRGTQVLRALTTLLEDPNLVPKTHLSDLQPPVTPNSKDSSTLCWPGGHLHTCGM